MYGCSSLSGAGTWQRSAGDTVLSEVLISGEPLGSSDSEAKGGYEGGSTLISSLSSLSSSSVTWYRGLGVDMLPIDTARR